MFIVIEYACPYMGLVLLADKFCVYGIGMDLESAGSYTVIVI